MIFLLPTKIVFEWTNNTTHLLEQWYIVCEVFNRSRSDNKNTMEKSLTTESVCVCEREREKDNMNFLFPILSFLCGTTLSIWRRASMSFDKWLLADQQQATR